MEDLLDALEEVEWGGLTWGDYPSCPFCYRLLEGIPARGKHPVELPKTHKPDCEWLRLMVKYGRRSNSSL